MNKIIDSYENMKRYLKFEDKQFVNWGMDEIENLFPIFNKVDSEWNNLKKKINDQKEKVYVRGYGGTRDIKQISDLYKDAGLPCDIVKDKSNNGHAYTVMCQITDFRKYDPKRKQTRYQPILHYNISHIWGFTSNPYLFNAPWNMIYTPRAFDPFTGHEAHDNNSIKKLIRPELEKLIVANYQKFIEEYNGMLDTDPCMQYIIQICKKKESTDNFYKEMLKQWQKLDKNNILSS